MTRAASSLSEQAVNEITNMILVERRFRPGDKLPNEMELAEELGISRITLREAVRVLCTRGLVEIQRGRGTFVLSGGPVLGFSGGGPDLSGAGVGELLEFLLCTLPEAACRAAEYAEEKEIQQLNALCQEIEEEATYGKNVTKQEETFLYFLCTASHNPVFGQIVPAVNRVLFGKDDFRDAPILTVPDQREIVRALTERDPELARSAAKLYLIHLARKNSP